MPTPKTQHTEKEIKQAYSLVTQDLFTRLIKAQENETVFIGSRGSFGSLKKSEGQTTSYLKKPRGEAYVFYRFKFTPASKLKQALNHALEKKYS
jgi:hypothetical protein